MNYLFDANVVLEAALRRQHWESASKFLASVPTDLLAISLFSLHACGFYLIKKAPEIFNDIVRDIVSRQVAVLAFEPAELHKVTEAATHHGLDFDDAFVYAIAERDALTIVSFDSDFDRTPRGRKTPAQVLQELPPIT